jgi:hypothetical protein
LRQSSLLLPVEVEVEEVVGGYRYRFARNE